MELDKENLELFLVFVKTDGGNFPLCHCLAGSSLWYFVGI